jgi:hypothetical protein
MLEALRPKASTSLKELTEQAKSDDLHFLYPSACWRRLNIFHLCRPNIFQGREPTCLKLTVYNYKACRPFTSTFPV